MSCVHITACQLASLPSPFSAKSYRLSRSFTCPSIFLGRKVTRVPFKLTAATSLYQQAAVVCLFGGKGKAGNGNEGSPWKALENAMGNLKKNQSIEDVLRQQIEKQEYYDDGGAGGEPPGGRGGGGFGEGDDESLSGTWDEIAQVICATMAFIFVYILIIDGEEVIVLARDLIRFLFTRQKSIRLNRVIDQWNSFLQTMKRKQEYDDPYWLERAIINTPTWYDSPAKYQYIIKVLNSRLRDNDYDDVNDDDNYGDE